MSLFIVRTTKKSNLINYVRHSGINKSDIKLQIPNLYFCAPGTFQISGYLVSIINLLWDGSGGGGGRCVCVCAHLQPVEIREEKGKKGQEENRKNL